MSTPNLRVALALICALFGSLEASARCALPNPVVSPAPGVVPINPVLYVFDTNTVRKAPKIRVVTASGNRVEARVTPLPSPAAFRVYSVSVAAPEGTEFLVSIKSPYGASERSFAYRASSKWTRPQGTLTTEKISETSHRWTCSSQESADLQQSLDAPAYRVTVTGASKVTFVVPGNMERLWSEDPERLKKQARTVNIGSVNCVFRGTYEWTTPSARVQVDALFEDGSTVTGAPVEVNKPKPPTEEL